VFLLQSRCSALPGPQWQPATTREWVVVIFTDGWVQQREGTNAATTTTMQAPEIDPASLIAALTLLGGGLVILRGRRASAAKG
jgi:hypothetical protein